MRYLTEAAAGLAIALLLAWCVLVSTENIPFVYQGF